MTKPAAKIQKELEPKPGRFYSYATKVCGYRGFYATQVSDAKEKVALFMGRDKDGIVSLLLDGMLCRVSSKELDITFLEEIHKELPSKKEAIKLIRAGGNGIVGSMGADPEVFMLDKRKRLIPAFEVLPEKGKSKALTTAYWDGFQGEFTVEPSHCLAFVMDFVREGMRQIIDNKKKPCVLSRKSVVPISTTILETTDRKFLEFGCVPSKNAYTEEDTAPDTPGWVVPFRMAGGHIHFGLNVKGIDYNQAVKDLDYYLGTLGVVLFQGMDDRRRRELYGKAGEYRVPAHGLEYRTLSNAWLAHPAVAMLVFEVARSVLANSVLRRLPAPEFSEEEIIDCINTSDLRKAKKIVASNFDLLYMLLGNTGITKEFLNAILAKGIKDITPKTIEEAWNLGGKKEWRSHTESPGKNLRTASNGWNPKTELRLT